MLEAPGVVAGTVVDSLEKAGREAVISDRGHSVHSRQLDLN